MKKQQILNCSFSSWYNQFKAITIKSRILPIPDDVLQYLLADGIVLPEGSLPPSTAVDSDEEEEDWGTDSAEAQAPSFPQFEDSIRKAIKALGGAVVPKLNWSAPKDATWIAATKTMKCTSPSDVFLLLKSSDFVSHDLTEPFDTCSDFDPSDKLDVKFELVLRRWHDLNPAGEFRCFVKNNELIGICQRHNTCFFSHLSQEEDTISDDIQEFFDNFLQEKFSESNFVFDVYRKDEAKVYLIDINPFCEVTDGLLFTWQELQKDSPFGNNHDELPVFRYIKTPMGVQPSPYQRYGMPTDFVHLSTGHDPHKLIDFLNLQKAQSQPTEDADSSDDNNGGSKAVT